jgi:hypothetical protein
LSVVGWNGITESYAEPEKSDPELLTFEAGSEKFFETLQGERKTRSFHRRPAEI